MTRSSGWVLSGDVQEMWTSVLTTQEKRVMRWKGFKTWLLDRVEEPEQRELTVYVEWGRAFQKETQDPRAFVTI